MSVTAIRVEGLGKEYRIGASRQRRGYATLRDVISEKVAALLRGNGKSDDKSASRVWAVRDVDLTVSEGEVLGIIGRNGSGKSTLLKMLSDIVAPTAGRAEIRGRVASLLEVGTGFHGELTGRENIFLNGAILGMGRDEIRRNFDRIVDFSGIGQFIDTPVKRYSSGMYVRLAFAVAAHLEPEVLIVDEVLAVGDFEFRQKCMGRMREVGRSGRTVLFVSHNMAAIESLCSRCVLIEGGRLVKDGEPYEVTREYRRRMSPVTGSMVADLRHLEGASRKVPILSSVHLVDELGDHTSCIPVSRGFEARIGVHTSSEHRNLLFVVRIDNAYGERMLTLRSPLEDSECCDLDGDYEISCRVAEFPLAPGTYRVGLAVYSRDDMIDAIDDVLSLTVTDGNQFSEGRGAIAGMCVARSQWGVGKPSPAARHANAPDILSAQTVAGVGAIG